MKIILIRQAESNAEQGARCGAKAFECAEEEAVQRAVVAGTEKRSSAAGYKVYTATATASIGTAELLFELSEPPEQSALLDEAPLRAFRETEKALPLWLWRAVGQAQWRLGSSRQPESRRATLERVGRFVDMLEVEDRDCVVICGPLATSALKSVLRRRGYCLEGGDLISRPLERVRAVKQSLHCGGCHHNCLLSQAKCQIGMNKAQERGIRREETAARG